MCPTPAGHRCVDDGGPNLSLISNPQQLGCAELAAVCGLSNPSLREQILDTDSDDHRGRVPP